MKHNSRDYSIETQELKPVKKLLTKFGAIIFITLIFTSCGSKPHNNNLKETFDCTQENLSKLFQQGHVICTYKSSVDADEVIKYWKITDNGIIKESFDWSHYGGSNEKYVEYSKFNYEEIELGKVSGDFMGDVALPRKEGVIGVKITPTCSKVFKKAWIEHSPYGIIYFEMFDDGSISDINVFEYNTDFVNYVKKLGDYKKVDHLNLNKMMP